MKYTKHPDLLRRLGVKVREIREEKGISQQELSYRTEVSRNQIGRIERGEISTGTSTLYEISLGLEVHIKELFDF